MSEAPASDVPCWIEGLSGWGGSLPVVLVAAGLDGLGRRSLLAALVGRALAVAPAAVAIAHEPGRGPRVLRPEGAGVFASSASRAGLSALAVARCPVGVDVEGIDAGEIPWGVLHPAEAAGLRALAGEDRPAAFARLWSVKEAYLKALRVGLSRDPSRFAVRFVSACEAVVEAPPDWRPARNARTGWRLCTGMRFAVSVVVTDPP